MHIFILTSDVYKNILIPFQLRFGLFDVFITLNSYSYKYSILSCIGHFTLCLYKYNLCLYTYFYFTLSDILLEMLLQILMFIKYTFLN